MGDTTLTGLGEPRMLIDGELVDAASGATFDNIDPATEETLGTTADAGPEDVERAVAAARHAFDETGWSTAHAFRKRCIEQLQQAFVEAKEELRAAMVAESGSPIILTYGVQLEDPVKWLSFWADLATSYDYERPLPDTEMMGLRSRGLLFREPRGVIAAITPFNFPLYLTLAKLGPALASGCTVVLKPAPDTPWTATILGRLVAEKTDLPPGVVNVVPSSGSEAGEALVSDPRVDMVSFTGSTATGRKIMHACSATVKKCFLELGGKSANILLDDADIASALVLSIPYACTHAGQGCALYTRMLVPRTRYEEAVPMLTTAFQTLPYGDPTNPAHLVGPVISDRQRERVRGYIGKGLEEGATLVAGGAEKPPDLDRGYYVQPTLFTDVDPDATIAQEEIFGPVLSVIPYDDEDDAVRIANDSIYGLSGSVWSANEERAIAVARRIRSGTVGVNGGQWLDVTRPFGGYRQSGVGRENGVEGFEEYLQTKVVALPG